MRIQRLVLKNFRSHKDTVLDLDRYNFIRGPNASGKSSIQMALEYLLTGRCAPTDASGRGVESLIRSGEKEFAVSATLAGGQTICRRRMGKSQIVEIDGRKAPTDVAEAFLSKSIGTADLLSAALNVDRFVKMSAADQQRLLAQLASAQRELPPDIRDALNALNEPTPELTDLAALAIAHKRYRDLAAEAARALDTLGQVLEPEASTELPTAPEVELKIQDLRREKELLITRNNNEAARCWQTAQPGPSVRQAQHEAAEVDQGRQVAIRRELAQLNMEQKLIETAVAALEEARDGCPTCGQPVAAEARVQRLETLAERRAEIEVLIQGAREELSDCEASIEVDDATSSETYIDERPALPFAIGAGVEGLEGRVLVVTERIAKAERVLEKIRHNQSAKEKWEASVRERTRLESRHLLLDKLANTFGPNGQATEVLRDEIRSLLERVNQHLAVFGYVCRVSFEPYEIRVNSPKNGSHGLSLRNLSESEQFRFGIALQVAIALSTGCRFVVIDRADALDTEQRRTLTGLLMSSGLDQAIVLATGEDELPTRLPKGVKFVALSVLPTNGDGGTKMTERRQPQPGEYGADDVSMA